MIRDPSDDEDVPLPPHGRPPAVSGFDPLPCRVCQTLTTRATLNTFGAQCYTCYEAYRAKPVATPKFVGDKRTGARSWAHALKARQDSGEVLSPAQRQMMRSALRYIPSTSDADTP